MKKSFNVESAFNDMRVDRWIRNNLGNIPQGLIEKNLRNGKIKLNNKKIKSSHKVKVGDKIELFNFEFKENIIQKKIKFNPSDEIIKENEELIIDNNDDFIVLNKSAGISVQGGTKSKKNLVDIFAKSEIFQNNKPFSVHRLDKDTSGVFIMAKHRQSAQLLTSLFRLRKVHKTYLAICHGELEKDSGEWNEDLTRYDNDKKITEKAKTLYKVLDKNSICSLVEMKPITGRKHQLRKQLYAIGNPIYGDQKYKLSNSNKAINKNLMLHSYEIKFMINEKKYTYKALLPDYFKKLLKTKRLNFPSS
ncbi:MAG: RluA family pseudouridine synthase [Candidatus Pelagibacter sp.]|jgi:23S rRNA pseudouridine955/2504/2580 synthase|nr:RluA family pseudouridine synthase [Candidatus Pelagibacter sp.]MBT3693444.1 RluA family pseudouridine synthase [Candidatus Pelagibacter sp.]MDB2526897.1 RluA family pseudouridine synthase [Candidatus Pelagibacter bacterium]|tara:strand:+ start:1079 stop:1993 length:915 start_codon:yes stop_codon:yes gene_type:complete